MPPRRPAKQYPVRTRIAGRVARLTAEEGDELHAHLEGLAAVWAPMAERADLPPDRAPCAHAKAALRMFLFPEGNGYRPIDRTVFERAAIDPPNLTTEAGPLAGCVDLDMIAAHVACGCTYEGSDGTVQVLTPRPMGSAAKESEAHPVHPDALPVPGYPWEAQAFQFYREQISGTVRDFVRGVGASGPCDHLICAVRRRAQIDIPTGAKLEAAILARCGAVLPNSTDPTVERWMEIPGDDGTLKAHLDSCTLGYDPARWPKLALMPDGATRPVRVPAAVGTILRWPEPVWS
jgi:hypothetical protein